MANITQKCPLCDKILRVASLKVIANKEFVKTECCNKTIIRTKVTEQEQEVVRDRLSFKFGLNDDLELLPFQKEGVEFLERNKFRGLLADDPGLGKTFQFLAPLRLHTETLCPALIVCKAGLRTQIGNEVVRMTGIPPQIIQASYEKCFINKKAIVIISYNMLWRMKWPEETWKKFKTVILDECQAIKNPSSNQAQKVKQVVATADHLIGASATPIKNRGLEYFPILNMIAPDRFPTETGYMLRWLEKYKTKNMRGQDVFKYGGVKPELLERWKDFTKDIIIRRKKEDVLPDLPPVRRTYRNCDLSEDVSDAYDEELKGFLKEYGDGGAMSIAKYANLLAYISRMRHLVGLSKIEDTLDELDEILLGSEEKVVVFVHHIAVAEILMKKLFKRLEDGGWTWEPVWLQGGMPNIQRDEIVRAFVEGPSRIMIASALASGEGVDGLQKVCGYAIMHERQWNPANEIQCEGRFSRIGSVMTSVLIKYMIAIGTIDEWFTRFVDEKRVHVNRTLDGKEVDIDETSLTREMFDIIAREGRKRWSL